MRVIRHTGFKAVSTGWQGHATLSNYWLRPWRKLIADLIRPFIGTRTMKNEVLPRCKRTRWHSVIETRQSRGEGPETGTQQDSHTTPSFPRRRESTGLRNSHGWPPTRHCGLDPQSRGEGPETSRQQAKTTNRIPSPLMGEESKPVPVLDTGAKGDNKTKQHRPIIADLIRNPEVRPAARHSSASSTVIPA